MIGFESHLPRVFGMEGGRAFAAMSQVLAGPRCRGIVAISEHAAKIFSRQHAGSPHAGTLARKLRVRYPNVEVAPLKPNRLPARRGLRLVFVGNHFARKGGCVAVKVAEMAMRRRVPIEVTVVSALEVGGCIWTDPKNASFFDSYLKLLTLPNVTLFRSLPNVEVVKLLRESDVSLLTTFGDTCGFSAIESLAQSTPVIATAQGALPEIVDHGTDGILLPIALNQDREWLHLGSDRRGEVWFEQIFAAEVDRLARLTYASLVELMECPAALRTMQRAAHGKAVARFCSQSAQAFWDDYYLRALDGDGTR